MNPKTTILIVDDQKDCLELLNEMLLHDNYELISAQSGKEALEKASRIIPDLIILDILMPDMNGFETCRQLRLDPLLTDIPVIMVTGLNDKESKLLGFEAGADDFTSKPFEVSELRARVRTITKLNRHRKTLTETIKKQNYELKSLNLKLKKFLEEEASEMANMLVKERDKFKFIADHSNKGYLILDENIHISYCNIKARTYLEIEEEKTDQTFLGIVKKNYIIYPEDAWNKWPSMDETHYLLNKHDKNNKILKVTIKDISTKLTRGYLAILEEERISLDTEEVLNFITKRRSIRNFTSEPVSEEDLMIILKSAMAAPSASNKKPWSFITVRERHRLDKLAEVHPYGKMLKEATLAIAVLGDPRISDYWVQDCSASTENILLAASGLELGSVWLGVYPREDRIKAVKEVLSIPHNIEILSLIAIGHPSKRAEPRTQYEENKVYKEKWEQRQGTYE